MDIPEDRRIMVFSKGILNGSKMVIPVGGHFNPNSSVGDRLAW